MKNLTFKLIILLIFTGLVSAMFINPVFAQSLSGNNVVLESEETLEETSFFSGNNVRINGDINATAFIAAGNVEINGKIDGDLFVAAQSVTINGTVEGSIFTASQNVAINDIIENNIYSAGATLNINANTKGSAFLAGESIYLEEDALIESDVFIGGNHIEQNGVINNNLISSSESLSVNGVIGGDLHYRSNEKVNLLNDAVIEGETKWRQIEPKTETNFYIPTFIKVLFSILSALVVWLVIRLLHRTFLVNFANNILQKPLKTFGFGFLSLILVPFIIFILLLTVIGIPLSLITLAVFSISLYVSKIIVAVSSAHLFQIKFGWSKGKIFWIFLLSLIILSLLVMIPFIGWLIRFVIFAFGLGAIVLSLTKKRKVTI